MRKNIILCGVGGQGIVLTSKLLAASAMAKGIPVMSAETIGMAQKGGSVFSFLRMGDDLCCPMFPKGTADLLIGFEPAEAVRMLAHCLQAAGKEEEGISLLLEGLQFAPPTGEHCCEIGEYFYEKGQWEQAIFGYENALHAERRTEQGAFVQEECYGFLPCIRLCVCYGRLGEWEMAKMYNEMAGVFRPEDASVRQNREYLAKRA